MAREKFINNTAFFDDKGLSSTAADHYVHIAEDLIEVTKSRMESLGFVDEWIELLDATGEPKLIKKGDDMDKLDLITARYIPFITKMHSFVAWVREALKTKNALIGNARIISLAVYLKEYAHADDETMKVLSYYEVPRLVDEDDMLNDMGADELVHYLINETSCSELGKFVTSSTLRRASEALNNAITNPSSIAGTGRETVITRREPTVDPDEFTVKLTDVQGVYRNAQAKLNKLKYDNRNKAHELNDAETRRVELKRQEMETIRKKLDAEYDQWRVNEIRRLSDLKIRIPDALMPVYELLKRSEKGESVLP